MIAILLRAGTKGVSAIQIAEQMLKKYDGLQALARASLADLRTFKGIGRDKAIALKSAFTLASRMAQELRHDSPLLDNPERIADLMREENRAYQVEQFQVIFLNTRRRFDSIQSPADIGWDPTRHRVLIPDMMANRLIFRELK